jgi:hypothetical protein
MFGVKMKCLQERTKALTKNMLKPKTPLPAGENCDEEIKRFPKVNAALSEKYKTKKRERDKAPGGKFTDPKAENTFRCLSEQYHNIYGSEKGLNSGALKRNLLGKYTNAVKLAEKVKIKPPPRGRLRQSNRHLLKTSNAKTDGFGILGEAASKLFRSMSGGNKKNRRGKKRTRRTRRR